MIPNNQITLLQNGKEYFQAIEAALESSVNEIYLESYIFANDRTGQRVAEALRRAALRDVNTHMLIDGFGSSRLPKTMIDFLESAGVMILKFRSGISPWTLRRMQLRRLHRKIVVVDQKVAFVGGINIIDDIDKTGQNPRFDYAVCVKGPLVEKIHKSVRRVWSRVAWTRLRPGWGAKKHIQAPLPKLMGSMRSDFLIRNNIRHRRDIENAYMEAIEQAQFEIILANAYFFPGLKFRHALMDAAARGVRIILLLQGKVEYRLLHYASNALRGSFLDAGMEIYEYHASLMHAKVAVIDERWATVGSSNLDPFSLLLALEGNIVVDDKDFAKTLKKSLMQGISKGARQIVQKKWRHQPMKLRLMSWLSYGLARIMIGMTGYAPENRRIRKSHINKKQVS